MKKISIAVALLAALSGPTWAINKCTGPDGKMVFQDAACAGKGEKINVRPASGDGASRLPSPPAEASSAAKPLTEVQRIEALVSDSQRTRRKQDLEALLVPNARGAIRAQRAECDQELKALQAKKGHANNNLAGATWEASISSEMTAVATRCDTKNRDATETLKTLRDECLALGGCK